MNLETLVMLLFPVLWTVAYGLLGLMVMLLIDGFTGRTSRFVWRRPRRAWGFLLAWPAVMVYVLLAPRYRCRRAVRRTALPRPFVKA